MKHGEYFPPKFEEKAFHCALCGVYCQQIWRNLFINNPHGANSSTAFKASYCTHCSDWSFWHDKIMIVPSATSEPPHPEMPEECQEDYLEAAAVLAASPRASAALLRLCVQKLLVHLGGSGKHIDNDIKALVKDGLPARVQKALDICRVVGNNAVHPGEIDLQDTPEVAHTLFKLINFVVEDRIARPNEVDALFEEVMPEGAKEAIERRDQQKTE